MNKKIAVVLVTFNRKEYLQRLLKSLVKQTVSIDSILILDNFSSDGTHEMLQDMEILEKGDIELEKLMTKDLNDISYMYYRMSKNTGGAGGFNKAFDIIRSYQFDYIWVMDDDVLPEEDCLNELLKYQNDEVMITIPNRTKNGYVDKAITNINLSNPFKIFMKKKTSILASDFSNDLKNISIVDMPFEGPLINMNIVKKVGLPNIDYFLQFDDTDYATRSLKYTKINFIVDAVLEKQIIPTNIVKNKFMNWKDYYAYRNDIIFCRKYGNNLFVKYLTPLFLWMNLMLKAILKRKWKNIKIINKSFIDGYFNRLGKTVEPGSI